MDISHWTTQSKHGFTLKFLLKNLTSKKLSNNMASYWEPVMPQNHAQIKNIKEMNVDIDMNKSNDQKEMREEESDRSASVPSPGDSDHKYNYQMTPTTNNGNNSKQIMDHHLDLSENCEINYEKLGLEIPSFNGCDNGYLYSGNIDKNHNNKNGINHNVNDKKFKNGKNGRSKKSIQKTAASDRPRRRISLNTKQSEIKNKHKHRQKNNSKMDNDQSSESSDDESESDEDGDDVMSNDNNKQIENGPYSIRIAQIKSQQLSHDYIKKIQSFTPNISGHTPSSNHSVYSNGQYGNHNHNKNHNIRDRNDTPYDSDRSSRSTSSRSTPSLILGDIGSNGYHTPSSPKKESHRKRGRPKGATNKNKNKRHNGISDLDGLTKWFFNKCKEIMKDLLNHKKATETSDYFISVQHTNIPDIIKQNVDLETIETQLLDGHYFNDNTSLMASYKQWKSDIKTVFENFAMVYGPKSIHKSMNYIEIRNKSLMELDDIISDNFSDLNNNENEDEIYDEIYDNCRIMLSYFNSKLHQMAKEYKKLLHKRNNDDWNPNKKGKYCQYSKQKDEILQMIYDHDLDNNKDKNIQKMNFILIVPKRKLQLMGKFNKRDIDLLPHNFLSKLARKGVITNSKRKGGINNTTITNQKRIFWNQYNHSKESEDAAIKRINYLSRKKRNNNNDDDDDYDMKSN